MDGGDVINSSVEFEFFVVVKIFYHRHGSGR
jgi:hypothetical protein